MSVSAQILVVSNKEEAALTKCLTGFGYAASRMDYSKFKSEKIASPLYDLILFLNNDGRDQLSGLKEALTEQTSQILIIGENPFSDSIQSIPTTFCDMELERRLASLVRLQVMKREFIRRSETTSQYGLKAKDLPDPVSEETSKNILLVGTESDVLGQVMLQLDSVTQINVCQNAMSAMDELQSTQYDAMILLGAGQGDVNLRFANDVRANSRLFNLPIIFILDHESNRQAAYVHGASDIVLNPSEMKNLRVRTFLHINQADYRFSLQKLFKTSKPLPVTDGPTDLYSFGFMRAHLNNLISDHRAEDKYLTIATLDITNLKAINEEVGYAAGDQVLRQIGNIISFLVRGEDICCRYEGNKFLIALPCTGIDQARFALNRVYGVTKTTEFAVAGQDKPVAARVEMGLAEMAEQETVEETIRRCKGVSMVTTQAAAS
jgi:two-component system cell cycle response regulator